MIMIKFLITIAIRSDSCHGNPVQLKLSYQSRLLLLLLSAISSLRTDAVHQFTRINMYLHRTRRCTSVTQDRAFWNGVILMVRAHSPWIILLEGQVGASTSNCNFQFERSINGLYLDLMTYLIFLTNEQYFLRPVPRRTCVFHYIDAAKCSPLRHNETK
ncbi:hypothetical protein F5I97DRAFT_1890013 [Phlebopus sp. FC_14]|nr:hypothetical protein F5I97DRAFT_1890013 [Phlebopus sp. FC_14]